MYRAKSQGWRAARLLLCSFWLAINVYGTTSRRQVTGTAYIHIDRGGGASADLSLMKLRAAVLGSDALAPAARSASSKDKDAGGKQSGSAGNASGAAGGPTVEAAPFQKVGKRVCCRTGLL